MKISQAPAPSLPARSLPRAEVSAEAPATSSTQSDQVQLAAAPAALPNTREVRIGRFIKGVTEESLEHLRYLSTIWSFNMVGTTVGLLGFTPLGIKLANDNPAVVGGLSIGGGIATGAAAAVGGYFWEKKHGAPKLNEESKPNKLADAALTVATGLKSLPQFIYPTVVGTAAQQDVIYDALDKMPLKHATASATIEVAPDLVRTGISGISQPGLTHTRILVDESYINDPHRAEELVMHEQAHAVDYTGGYGLLGSLNWLGPFGSGPFVSEYAKSNRYEDFAESYEHYMHDPEGFRAQFPEKASIIERAQQLNPIERLMDRPSVREVGRDIGQALGTVPYARTIMETGLGLLAPIQVHRGASALEKGLAQGDDALKLQGKMNLASGILMGLGNSTLAVGSSALSLALQQTSRDNPEALKNANETANKVLAVAAGPLGMAGAAVGQELAKAGVDLNKIDFSSTDDRSPGMGNVLKGLAFTVGGAVAGSLAGVAIGTALTGPAGIGLSAFWGRIGGAAIGLGAYGTLRARSKEQADPSPYALTKDDKIFLTKIVGGAAVGAAAGTAAGVMGGRALGGLLGNLVFGPGSEAWAGSIGSWAGALVGSYAGGKTGAVVGRKLTSPETPTAE